MATNQNSNKPSTSLPVICTLCDASFPLDRFRGNDGRLLRDAWRLAHFTAELEWLLRVKQFYERHPELIDRIKPDFVAAMESDDPEVWEKLWSGAPLNEAELSELSLPQPGNSSAWSQEDEEVAEYLRNTSFSLPHRLEFVMAQISRYRRRIGMDSVYCPECMGGRLRLHPDWPGEDWLATGIRWTWKGQR